MKSEVSSMKRKKDTSSPENDIYLYLSWSDSKNILGLAICSSPLCFSKFVGSDLFDLLDSFGPNLFIFSSESIPRRFQAAIGESSVMILREDGILIYSDEYCELLSERNSAEEGVFNMNEEKICPLRHLLLLSRTLDEKQLNAFQLAIEYGFPTVDLVDFEKKTTKVRNRDIIKKWNSMISDQKGSLEEDFVRTLRSALKSLENEYHPLFERIHLIIPPGKHLECSLAPLFDLLPYMPAEKKRKIPNQPRIGIESLRFEVVLELEEERIPDLIKALREELSSDYFQVAVNEMGRIRLKNIKTQDIEYFRLRISIILEVTSHFIGLEDSIIVTNELAYLVIEKALHKLSAESYKKFKKHKPPEFWLKNAGIAVEVSPSIADRTNEMIRNHFRFYLDPSRKDVIVRKSEDRIKILSYLYFSPAYDYVIDMKEEGLFLDMKAEDPYTNIGIEHLMRKEFDLALKSFRMAGSGLLQDYRQMSSTGKPRRIARNKYYNKIKILFSPSDVSSGELLSSQKYTDESNPEKILDMLRVTEKWIRTTTRLRDIDILERQIRLQQLNEEDFADTVSMLRGLYKRINVRLFKNFHNFIETIGSFYVNLLQEIEKESPESVEEWMNLKI